MPAADQQPERPAPSTPAPGAGAAPRAELSKAYRPSEHEDRIRARWDEARAFHVEPSRVDHDAEPAPEATDGAKNISGGRGRGRPPYSIVIPPPNVTAALHLGHALNNTLQDVLVRAHRMMGYESMWMPGTDHAGIATQTVVEKRLIANEGKKRTDYSRDEFVAKVQAFKDEYEAVITGQLKAMGCSCDWERQRFTMDDICARAVREAFFRLFRDGLIYRGKRLVNWDPATQTVLADDEVENEEIDGNFYYLRYPLCDKEGRAISVKLGDGDPVGFITVATTRPETYLGDTAVAVNPRDPRWPTLRESATHVKLPFVGRVIPIVADDYVVMPAAMQSNPEEAKKDPKAAFATGFLKVTPGHDTNDYALWQRHQDEMPHGLINVMAPDASISDKHGWTDVGEAGAWVGLSREEARKEIVKAFKAAGLCENVKPYRHSVGHSYRSHVPIEPYLSDQWYVAVKQQIPSMPAAGEISGTDVPVHSLAGLALKPLLDGDLKFVPERYAKTYQTWLENLRDWPISRQLWWGHRIPVWSIVPALRNQSNQLPDWIASPGDFVREFQRRLDHLGGALGLGHAFAALEGGFDALSQPRVFICPLNADADMAWKKVIAYANLAATYGEREPHGMPASLGLSLEQSSALNHLCEAIESASPEPDPDVLDTWFSSGLWPLSTMGWPEPAQSPQTAGMLDAFNPTDVLCTAREIITLWVSRMVMFNRYLLAAPAAASRHQGSEASSPDAQAHQALSTKHQAPLLPGPSPYRDVFIHAMIQDGEGRKMSKSLGNGVDPLDIIATHGADAMRFTLCHMTTQTQDVRMPVSRDANGKNTSPKFDLGRNFCNKLWNAARFAISILEDAPIGSDGAPSASSGSTSSGHRPELALGAPMSATHSLADRWMLSRLASSITQINGCIERYEYADYAQSIYDLLWRDFCDWYLEAIKPTVKSPTPEGAAQRAALRCTLDAILRLLHPICPFITEAISEKLRAIPGGAVAGLALGEHASGLLCLAPWPEASGDLIDADAEERFEAMRSLVTAIREARSQQNVAPKRRITLHLHAGAPPLDTMARELIETLAGVEKITTDAPAAGAPFSALTLGGREYSVSGLIDAAASGAGGGDASGGGGAERERLTKKLDDLAKSIAALEGRLNNPGYADRAPAKLVQQTRDQLAAQQAERDATTAALGRLG